MDSATRSRGQGSMSWVLPKFISDTERDWKSSCEDALVRREVTSMAPEWKGG